MRKELGKLANKRIKVFAEVDRFGKKHAYRGYNKDTVCLINVKDEYGNELCDHLWLVIGKQLKDLNINTGDKISFEARSKSYWKGYKGHREDVDRPIVKDYKLSNPTKFVKIVNHQCHTPTLL